MSLAATYIQNVYIQIAISQFLLCLDLLVNLFFSSLYKSIYESEYGCASYCVVSVLVRRACRSTMLERLSVLVLKEELQNFFGLPNSCAVV